MDETPGGISAALSVFQGALQYAARQERALELARALGDDVALAVVGARLLATLLGAQRAIDPLATVRTTRSSRTAEVMTSLGPWATRLNEHPLLICGTDLPRLFRWLMALHEGGDAGLLAQGGPDLFELDVHDWRGDDVALRSLHIAMSRLATSWSRAAFDDVAFDRCKFEGATFRETSWRRCAVRRCELRTASYQEAALDEVEFVGCDLTGVDFSASSLTLMRAKFVRCDLRHTRWDGRDLRELALVDCKAFGMRGVAVDARAALTRIDLSPDGDGSQYVASSHVMPLGAGEEVA